MGISRARSIKPASRQPGGRRSFRASTATGVMFMAAAETNDAEAAPVAEALEAV